MPAADSTGRDRLWRAGSPRVRSSKTSRARLAGSFLRFSSSLRLSSRTAADLRQLRSSQAALLEALHIDRAAVVTLSSGGPAGYLLAARHPGRVTALIAISSNSGPARPTHNAGPIAQAVFASWLGQWLTSSLAARKPAWLVRALLRGESTLAKEYIDAQAAHVLRTPATLEWLRGFIATIYPYRPRKPGTDNDTRQLAHLTALPLKAIRCPTLIVHGTHDADVPFEHATTAWQQISGACHH